MNYVLFTMDCELAWGFADLSPLAERVERMRDDSSAVRDAYRTLVDLYDAYSVPATWAFVGHLFYDTCNTNTHPRNNQTGSVDPHSSHASDPLYYGPDLVEMVLTSDVDHEIGGHSLTHPEFTQLDEPGAQAELETMIDAAADHGIEVSSFVFPRNFVAHTGLLKDMGIKTYRTKTVGENYIFRDGLKPFFFGDEQFWSVPPVRPEQTNEGVVRIKSSRLLHEVRWCYLHPWRLKRTLRAMNDGDIVHFAFHPHDLLGYYRLDWVLDRVLGVVEQFRDQGELEVVTMGDLPELV